MAFHVACPITCKRICFCTLGFPRHLHHPTARDSFFNDVCRIEGFLSQKWLLQPCISATVDVHVPHVDAPSNVAPTTAVAGDVAGDGDFALLSAQNKRAAMQKKAAAASVAFEDYARRFEAGCTGAEVADFNKDEQNPSAGNIMCRLCFFGENEVSERAKRMLSCKSCGKKYHRNCLGDWARHRDLFYWSSWKCPSCRVCEVCRRTGDPNKFMFCKRCDSAYHCYCQHPPHKNVSSGPYLCPKHTKCHSCGSTVPGNGLSTRWFLGYTCCDACGRLFVKGNYCPVCLKVYRDSESTPMVCCDVCQRWVHCQCDGISDEKYLQFQVDRDLSYRCGTCRGECYQVKDIDDAVQELWRRRDKADQGLIASLRTAAGLPSQEEIFSISPFSDDEDNGPIKSKNEYGRSLKFSFKGFVDKSPKNSKEHFKNSSKYSKKKKKDTSSVKNAELLCSSEEKNDVPFFGYDGKNGTPVYHSNETNRVSSPALGSNGNTEGASSINEWLVSRKTVDEFTQLNDVKNSKDTHSVGATKSVGVRTEKPKHVKGKKLVIHLGARNRNTTDSQISDGSCCQREDFLYSNGGEGNSQQVSENITVDRHDTSILPDIRGPIHRGRDENYANFSTRKSEYLASGTQAGAFLNDTPSETAPPKRNDQNTPVATGDRTSLRKHHEDGFTKGSRNTYDAGNVESQSFLADVKPVLKLKIKNPNLEGQMQWGSSRSEEERISIKGQRSKRKRLAIQPAKAFSSVDERDTSENSRDEMMDANWILKKLGMDAVGKRVEVQQPDGFWAKGTVMGVLDGNSKLSVELDDGLVRPLNLGGDQGIRFISQKNKRPRT